LPCGFFFYLLSSSIFFSSPNLSGRRLDVYHTSLHMVWPYCEFRMQVCNVLLAGNTGSKKSPSGHHHTNLSGYIFTTKAHIDNQKLDGCIVWNAHNTVLGEEARLIYIVQVCYVKTGRYGKPSNIIISLHRKNFQL